MCFQKKVTICELLTLLTVRKDRPRPQAREREKELIPFQNASWDDYLNQNETSSIIKKKKRQNKSAHQKQILKTESLTRYISV